MAENPVIVEHSYKIDGHTLVYRKETIMDSYLGAVHGPTCTFSWPDAYARLVRRIILTKSIDDRKISEVTTFTEGVAERKVETEMTEEQIEQFNRDWSSLQSLRLRPQPRPWWLATLLALVDNMLK